MADLKPVDPPDGYNFHLDVSKVLASMSSRYLIAMGKSLPDPMEIKTAEQMDLVRLVAGHVGAIPCSYIAGIPSGTPIITVFEESPCAWRITFNSSGIAFLTPSLLKNVPRTNLGEDAKGNNRWCFPARILVSFARGVIPLEMMRNSLNRQSAARLQDAMQADVRAWDHNVPRAAMVARDPVRVAPRPPAFNPILGGKVKLVPWDPEPEPERFFRNLTEMAFESREQQSRFDIASTHPYECRCEICQEWWTLVGEEK